MRNALSLCQLQFDPAVLRPRRRVVSWNQGTKLSKSGRCQAIFEAARAVNPKIFLLSHGGPINTPEDATKINQLTDAQGFVGASSLERMGVEESLTALTRQFKQIPVDRV